jgi:hypothetical protein
MFQPLQRKEPAHSSLDRSGGLVYPVPEDLDSLGHACCADSPSIAAAWCSLVPFGHFMGWDTRGINPMSELGLHIDWSLSAQRRGALD